MKRKRILNGIAATAGIAIIIIDGKTALEGASRGIELCLKSVIPSLLPFIFLTNLLTISLTGMQVPFLRPLASLMGIPDGCESLLLSAFLGGYPIGAQSVSLAYRTGKISKSDAERMLAFANNAGPSFVFGILSQMFSSVRACWIIWGVQIAGAILTSLIMPSVSGSTVSSNQYTERNVSVISVSLSVIARISGLIILFRIVIEYLEKWFLYLLSPLLKIGLIGVLELSNGCLLLQEINDDKMRLILAGSMLSFGGLCVTMQTLAVTEGLSLKKYFIGKGIHFVLTVVLSLCMIHKNLFAGIAMISVVILTRFGIKKAVAFHKKILYNTFILWR